MSMDSAMLAIKWTLIVFLGGFIGYFGKYLGKILISKFHKRKTENVDKSKAGDGKIEDLELEKERIKLEKKKLKLQKKKLKLREKN